MKSAAAFPARRGASALFRLLQRLCHAGLSSFAPILLLLALLGWGCGSSSSPSSSTGPASASYADQFDYVWQTFDLNYSYFVYKNIDWQSLKDTYRPMAIQATSEEQFTQVLVQMLGNLHDLHVRLVDPSGNSVPTFTPANFINFDTGVWQQYLQTKGSNIQQTAEYTTGYLDGVGYFAVPSWDPASSSQAADLDAALEQFQNAPALIVDVRMNGGGDGNTANSFAGRFADQSRIGGYDRFRDGAAHTDFGPILSRSVAPRGPWQYRGPVYLLIGRGCYSSNEDFIAQMREYPNVTVVGDTSGGHSGYPVIYPLSSGWQFTVSTWIDYTAEMQVIEDRGIDPAIFVPVTSASFQAGTDPVLDYAIGHLGS